MVEWRKKSKRKHTGGMLRTSRRRDKKLYEKGGLFAATKAAPAAEAELVEAKKGTGNTQKFRLITAKFANVLDPKSGKTQKMELVSVAENPANREYARRNIMTKGAIIEVKAGSGTAKATITSRPGQHGIINAILAK